MTCGIVVVYLYFETLTLAERNQDDAVNAGLVILAFVERLKHVQLDGVTTETLQTVFLHLCVVLPNIRIECIFVVRIQIQFLVLEGFFLSCIEDLNSFVLIQTCL